MAMMVRRLDWLYGAWQIGTSKNKQDFVGIKRVTILDIRYTCTPRENQNGKRARTLCFFIFLGLFRFSLHIVILMMILLWFFSNLWKNGTTTGNREPLPKVSTLCLVIFAGLQRERATFDADRGCCKEPATKENDIAQLLEMIKQI